MDILIFISILPVIIIGSYIYKKDRNKESTALLTKLFIAGIGSCFVVLILNAIFGAIFPFVGETDTSKLSTVNLMLHVFIGVALIEEFSKWIFAYLISYNHKEFDEFYDMILYAVFVALGFAAFENILYVFTGGLGTGIARGILAVPGHAWDGVFMGYYLGLAKINELNGRASHKTKYLILSILVPTILHGIYDYCLFLGSTLAVLIFFVFVIGLYILAIRKIKEVSSISRKMKYKNTNCPNCGKSVESDYCPNCGTKNE